MKTQLKKFMEFFIDNGVNFKCHNCDTLGKANFIIQNNKNIEKEVYSYINVSQTYFLFNKHGEFLGSLSDEFLYFEEKIQ